MRRKSVFIGSSSEELMTAELAKSILEKDFDVTIWNDNVWDTSVFKINQNFLNDLLKATLRFDFGLLLGTGDDKVTFRGNDALEPRDNVLFELGLFLGRLGISNCAFVIEKELKVLTDVSGISLLRYSKGNSKEFKEAIESVKTFFLAQVDTDVNFFPSSTLAAVYFENLISPTCRHLISNGCFRTDNGSEYEDCLVRVIIPRKLNVDINLQLESIKKKYNTKNQSFNYDGRPRFISIEAEIVDNRLIFVDFPTILSGINYAISNLLPRDFNTMSSDYTTILDRELDRFILTLKQLLLRHGFDEMVDIVRV
ncbi:MAG: DNA-binding protein [Pedobacter sp.]|nr:MAG: DNA-binding protein [Pedobacter sp.]